MVEEINPTAVTVENLRGAGGGEASRPTGVGPKEEGGKTIVTGEEGGEESMSGGKAVPVAFTKAASKRRREDEDQRGASRSTEETAWRWRARAEALVVQRRDAVAERLGLVPTKRAERGVVSIKQGSVDSHVAFLRVHLVDAACHKLPQSH